MRIPKLTNRFRVKKVDKGCVTHCLAVCRECDWCDDSYERAGRRARAHVAKTGHMVDVEVARYYTLGVTSE